jgi:hypothetical protein
MNAECKEMALLEGVSMSTLELERPPSGSRDTSFYAFQSSYGKLTTLVGLIRYANLIRYLNALGEVQITRTTTLAHLWMWGWHVVRVVLSPRPMSLSYESVIHEPWDRLIDVCIYSYHEMRLPPPARSPTPHHPLPSSRPKIVSVGRQRMTHGSSDHNEEREKDRIVTDDNYRWFTTTNWGSANVVMTRHLTSDPTREVKHGWYDRTSTEGHTVDLWSTTDYPNGALVTFISSSHLSAPNDFETVYVGELLKCLQRNVIVTRSTEQMD